jgi:transposase
MLHAGLDLGRRKLHVCLVSDQGEHLDQLVVPPDVDSLRTLARRIDEVHGEPVCAVVESMTGARLVHDALEQEGWSVEIADAQKVKGLAPLACKTDKIDSLVLATLSQRDVVPAIWLPDPEDSRGARARPLSPAPGQAPLDAQAPYPLDPDQFRAALSGHRPLRRRGPAAVRAA